MNYRFFSSEEQMSLKNAQAALVLTAFLISPSIQAQVTSGKLYRLLSTCGTGTKALSIEGGRTDDYAAAVISTVDLAKKSQIFKIENVGSNVKLTAQHSGKVLDVLGGDRYNYAQIIQYSYGGSLNQLFTIKSPASGVYQFQSANSGRSIDLTGASTTDGNKFIQYDGNTSCAQRFKLQEVASTTTPPPPTNTLPTDSIFSPTSFWYKPIPTNVTLHAKPRVHCTRGSADGESHSVRLPK
jgi:hypothetical protein